MRAVHAPAKTKFIAITGFGQPADCDATLAAGFNRHVIKPVDTEALPDLLE